jgi:hypothetical protein
MCGTSYVRNSEAGCADDGLSAVTGAVDNKGDGSSGGQSKFRITRRASRQTPSVFRFSPLGRPSFEMIRSIQHDRSLYSSILRLPFNPNLPRKVLILTGRFLTLAAVKSFSQDAKRVSVTCVSVKIYKAQFPRSRFAFEGKNKLTWQLMAICAWHHSPPFVIVFVRDYCLLFVYFHKGKWDLIV